MIEFVGYNDARAIKAYNKKNLTMAFIWFGVICFVITVVALSVPIYELLYIWGGYLFLIAICSFAMFCSKYDEKAFKELNIRTKHVFKICDLKLYRDGNEIKNVKNIKVFSYKTYIFLELKRSYYFVPIDESNPSKEKIETAIREVIHQIDVSKAMDEVKKFIENNKINGEFTFSHDLIIWVVGNYKYTYYIDFNEVHVNKDKLTFRRFYRNITHYHINLDEVIDDIKRINKKRNHISSKC